MKRPATLLSLAVFAAILPARAETLLWYTFDPSRQGQAVSLATTVPNDANPGTFDAVVTNGSYKTWNSWQSALPSFTNGYDTVCKVQDGYLDQVLRANEGAVAINGQGDYGAALAVSDPGAALALPTFTLEISYRVLAEWGWHAIAAVPYDDPAQYWENDKRSSVLLKYENGASSDWLIANLLCSNEATGELAIVDLRVWVDVKDDWNHAVLAVDSVAKTASLFLGTRSVTASLPGPVAWAGAPCWCFGGTLGNDYCFNGLLDEIRLSDRVLAEHERLRFKKDPLSEGDPICHFSFDNGFRSLVRDNEIASVAALAPEGGAAPTIEALAGHAREFVKAPDRSYARDGNAGCLLVQTNHLDISFSAASKLRECDNRLTVEYFLRMPPVSVWSASVLGLVRLPSSPLFTVEWEAGWQGGQNIFDWRIDAGTGYDQNLIWKYGRAGGAAVLDETWHHVAMTLQRTNSVENALWTNTLVRSYVDYELVHEAEVSGEISWADEPLLTIGRSDALPEARIDELRISQGVLPVESFLRVGSASATVIYLR